MNNSKLLFVLGCVVAVMLTAPILSAAPRGGGGGHQMMAGHPGMAGRPGMGACHRANWHRGTYATRHGAPSRDGCVARWQLARWQLARRQLAWWQLVRQLAQSQSR